MVSRSSGSQDVGRTMLSTKPLGEGLSLPLPASGSPRHSLVCGGITVISARSHGIFRGLCLPKIPFSYKDISHIALGSTLVQYDLILTLQTYGYMCKDPISKQGHIHRHQGLTSTDLSEGHSQLITLP